jgi:hypothetical protein
MGNITIMTLSGLAAQKQGLLFALMAAELPFSQRLESRIKKLKLNEIAVFQGLGKPLLPSSSGKVNSESIITRAGIRGHSFPPSYAGWFTLGNARFMLAIKSATPP